MAKVSDLPNELLRNLFLMISPKDLKMTALVSRRWRKICEDPVLWKWCVVCIRDAIDINKLYHRKIRYVQEIQVIEDEWKAKQLEQLFQAILELPKLKKIWGLVHKDLTSVNSELLARALAKLEELILFGNDLTTNNQRLAIFNQISKYGCIKKLVLISVNLDALELKEEILAKVMSGLDELRLTGVRFTNIQVQEIFKSISENNQLNKVSFGNMNLSPVEPEMLAIALTRVESVDLTDITLSPHQTRVLFTKMGQNSEIKSFSSVDNDLSTAEPRLFARGLSKLKKANLCESNLTHDQVQALLIELKQSCQLKSFTLDADDLSAVDADDLATLVANVEEMGVNYTQLSSEQITAVLRRAQQNTNLKSLSLYGNSISGVDSALVTTVREMIRQFEIDSESEGEGSDDGENVSENDTDSESDN